MKTNNEHILRWRVQHHNALSYLFPHYKGNGKSLWRALCNMEEQANQWACQWCNGEIDNEEWEAKREFMLSAIASLNGGQLPDGVFINSDARGYTLKVKEAKVPDGMQTDWGRYGLLAAQID